MMKLELDADLCILQGVGEDEPEREGCTYALYDGPINWSAPNSTSRLRFIDGAPVWEDNATLEQIKLRKRAEITAQRLRADADHFTYMDKAIRTADKDMIDLFSTNGYVALFGAFDDDWPGGWKAIDDSYLLISTVDEWKAFYKAMYRTGIANFHKSQSLKAQIDAATTAEEVEAVQWAAAPEPVEAV